MVNHHMAYCNLLLCIIQHQLCVCELNGCFMELLKFLDTTFRVAERLLNLLVPECLWKEKVKQIKQKIEEESIDTCKSVKQLKNQQQKQKEKTSHNRFTILQEEEVVTNSMTNELKKELHQKAKSRGIEVMVVDALEKTLHAMDADYDQRVEKETKQISQLKCSITIKHEKHKEKEQLCENKCNHTKTLCTCKEKTWNQKLKWYLSRRHQRTLLKKYKIYKEDL